VRTPTSCRIVRSLVQLSLAAAFAGGVLADGGRAWAARPPGWSGGGGNGSNGNGRHNRNSFIINSPSISHDMQHIRNVNVDGNTVTPAAMCIRPRRCKIIQSLTVFDR
jgi:hypothetical protein